MSEKPILFSGPMVRAIIEGCKNQTRRIVNPKRKPFAVGDRLWVRETHRPYVITGRSTGIEYRAGGHIEIDSIHEGWSAMFGKANGKWRTSIFMPRWASRITLEITEVRRERLHDITEDDAKAEGVKQLFLADCDYIPNDMAPCVRLYDQSYRVGFFKKWCDIHGNDSWEHNPEVYVYRFDVLEGAANVPELAVSSERSAP